METLEMVFRKLALDCLHNFKIVQSDTLECRYTVWTGVSLSRLSLATSFHMPSL
jgi:hypothetical protein